MNEVLHDTLVHTLRRAAKVINYFSAVCCTSVTTPSCHTFSRARGIFIFVRNFSRGIFAMGFGLGPKADAPLISSRETKWQAVKTSTTLDSDSRRKIPREKFHTKINTPRARENVRQLGVVTRFLRSQEYSTKFSTMV